MEWGSLAWLWQTLVGVILGAFVGGLVNRHYARKGSKGLDNVARELGDRATELRGLTHSLINHLEGAKLIGKVNRNDQGEPEPAQTHVLSGVAREQSGATDNLTFERTEMNGQNGDG